MLLPNVPGYDNFSMDDMPISSNNRESRRSKVYLDWKYYKPKNYGKLSSKPFQKTVKIRSKR